MRSLVKWFLVILVVKGSRSVLWPCTTSEDCSKVPQARCSIYGYCQCPAGYVFSTDVTRCLPEALYGVACQQEVQCSHMLTGAKCEAGLCTCDTDYTYVRGRCRQLANLHDQCNNDIDCFFSYNREAVVCREGSCECAKGFYERSTNVCRRQVDLGEACLVNQDCNSDNLVCRENVCEEAAQTKTFRDIGVQAKPEEKTKTEGKATYDKQQQTSVSKRSSDNENELENEIRKESSSSGATAKRVRLHSSVDSATKDGSTPGFGDSCTEETQECAGVPYSVCMMGQCHCREGFFNVQGACKAELGEFVRASDDCGAGIFTDGRCVCRNDQFYNYNMRSCLKGVLGINTSCTASSQCSPYGAAYCTQASPKRCTCYPYAVYDAQRQMCVPRKGYEEYCEKNEHCTLANTRCSEVNTCVCRPNYLYVNEQCKAAQGGTCSTANDCGFDKAVCEPEKDSNEKEKKCDCTKGHVYHDNTCLKEAEEYEDDCNVNEQCQPLLGNLAKCMEGKCKCDESCTHFKDGQCHMKKALDERCSGSSECFVEDGEDTVECRNSACQCKFGYTADVERQVCIRPRGKSSSGRPSALKVITLLLTSAAVLITGSALRDAYYA